MGIFDGILSAVTPFIPIVGPAISALSGLIGSHESQEGQEDANVANQNLTREGMAFNANEARLNRQFQQEQADKAMSFAAGQTEQQYLRESYLSNTAITRAKMDAEAAGFNPMLPFMKGAAASTPSVGAASGVSSGGSSATSPGLATMQNTKGMSIMTGLQAAEAAAQVSKTLAETKEIKSREDLNRANIPRTDQEAATSGSQQALNHAIAYQIYERLRVIMPEEHGKLVSETELLNRLDRLNYLREDLTRQEAKVMFERIGLTRAEAELAALELPRARNEAAAQGDWWKRTITPYNSDIGRVVGTAAGAAVGGGIGLRLGRGAAAGMKSSAESVRREPFAVLGDPTINQWGRGRRSRGEYFTDER